MNTNEIEALFERLAQQYGMPSETSKNVFTLLVKITLKYRDNLIASGEKTLTVEETKEALDELLKVMQLKKYSDPLPNRIKKLVILWYDELKLYLYH